MSRHAVHQHHIHHRGRAFHFVAYEGEPANPARGKTAIEPAWYLMASGKRWEVMPTVAEQPEEERASQFQEWLDENVFS
ncbi:MAG TPA: hypothetical protein VK012_02090 [Gemmatimonadales bacterium]|nr:hypothetical protein [Gemmatimonadales bacterium]